MKNRYITDASMITAIAIVFLLISRLTGGIVEEMLTFILPIPVALYTLKYDYKKGILTAVSIAVLSFLVISPIKAVCYILPANIVGLIYGEVLKKKTGTHYKLLIVILGSIIVNVLATVVFSKIIFGYTIIEDTKALVNEIVIAFEAFDLKFISAELLESLMIGLIPCTIICVSIMEGLLTHIITSMLAKRVLKVDLGGAFIAFELSMPKIVSYLFMPIMLLTVFFLSKVQEFNGDLPILLVIGVNITFILLLFYVLQGLIVTSLFAKKKNASFLMAFALLSIFIFPFIVMGVGLYDSVFDLKSKLLIKDNQT